MKNLKTISLYRYLQSKEFYGKKLLFNFRDEAGKLTVAKYKLIKVLKSNVKNSDNYFWKLDGRSIRYMKRVEVVENLGRRRNGSTSESNWPCSE